MSDQDPTHADLVDKVINDIAYGCFAKSVLAVSGAAVVTDNARFVLLMRELATRITADADASVDGTWTDQARSQLTSMFAFASPSFTRDDAISTLRRGLYTCTLPALWEETQRWSDAQTQEMFASGALVKAERQGGPRLEAEIRFESADGLDDFLAGASGDRHTRGA